MDGCGAVGIFDLNLIIYARASATSVIPAFAMFLSDRYIAFETTWTPDGPEAERVLFPFATKIPHDALETWTLEVKG